MVSNTLVYETVDMTTNSAFLTALAIDGCKVLLFVLEAKKKMKTNDQKHLESFSIPQNIKSSIIDGEGTVSQSET